VAELLINIDVEDLEAAIAFYTQAFELHVSRHFGDWAELGGAAAPLYLLPKKSRTPPFEGAAGGRDYARHWTPLHLDWVVPDLAAAMRRVEAAGARREGEVSEHRYGLLALYTDPFGHGFCLLQFTGRGYGELATARA
jgi:predicted enzyme related to lactoylglutathione lyase